MNAAAALLVVTQALKRGAADDAERVVLADAIAAIARQMAGSTAAETQLIADIFLDAITTANLARAVESQQLKFRALLQQGGTAR